MRVRKHWHWGAQRDDRCYIPESIQGQFGWGLEWPDPVERIPAHCWGLDWMVSSNPSHSVEYPFCIISLVFPLVFTPLLPPSELDPCSEVPALSFGCLNCHLPHPLCRSLLLFRRQSKDLLFSISSHLGEPLGWCEGVRAVSFCPGRNRERKSQELHFLLYSGSFFTFFMSLIPQCQPRESSRDEKFHEVGEQAWGCLIDLVDVRPRAEILGDILESNHWEILSSWGRWLKTEMWKEMDFEPCISQFFGCEQFHF